MRRYIAAALWLAILALPVTADITADVNPPIRTSTPGQSVDYTVKITNYGAEPVDLRFKTTGLTQYFSVAVVYTGGKVRANDTATGRIIATANTGVAPGLYTFAVEITPIPGSPVTRQFKYNVTAVMLPNCDLLDGWYYTGATQWVHGSVCVENASLESVYRDYDWNATAGNCTYVITGTQWLNNGTIRFLDNGTDTYNECNATECGTGACNGFGACGWHTTGEQNCPACQTCENATGLSCRRIPAGQADTEGANTCSGSCNYCDGSGACASAGGFATETNCTDLCDNDADGCTDATDYDCGGAETCGNTKDDNCNGLTDAGDPGCVVVGGMNAPAKATVNVPFTVGCQSTAVSNCIGVNEPANVDCAFTVWNGLTAEFTCISTTPGVKELECHISNKPDGSCAVGNITGYPTETSRKANVSVEVSSCSVLTTQGGCEAAPNCDWCPNACATTPGRWSGYGGTGVCANATTCRTQAQYYCEANPQQCAATCDNQDRPCNSYCSGSTSYHSGWCGLNSTCTCNYNVTDCNSLDGWYITGYTWESGICSTCLECNTTNERSRNYFCNATTGLCDYTLGGYWSHYDAGGTRPIPDGEDPQDRCPETGISCPTDCIIRKLDGYCDGAGSCRTVSDYCPSGTMCYMTYSRSDNATCTDTYMGSPLKCAYGPWECSTVYCDWCGRRRDYYLCDGGGRCDEYENGQYYAVGNGPPWYRCVGGEYVSCDPAWENCCGECCGSSCTTTTSMP